MSGWNVWHLNESRWWIGTIAGRYSRATANFEHAEAFTYEEVAKKISDLECPEFVEAREIDPNDPTKPLPKSTQSDPYADYPKDEPIWNVWVTYPKDNYQHAGVQCWNYAKRNWNVSPTAYTTVECQTYETAKRYSEGQSLNGWAPEVRVVERERWPEGVAARVDAKMKKPAASSAVPPAEVPQWRLLRDSSQLPGYCVCEIYRQDCDFHR